MVPAPWVVAKKPPLCVARTQSTRDARGAGSRSFGITPKTPGAFLRVSPEGVKHRDRLNKPLSSGLA